MYTASAQLSGSPPAPACGVRRPPPPYSCLTKNPHSPQSRLSHCGSAPLSARRSSPSASQAQDTDLPVNITPPTAAGYRPSSASETAAGISGNTPHTISAPPCHSVTPLPPIHRPVVPKRSQSSAPLSFPPGNSPPCTTHLPHPKPHHSPSLSPRVPFRVPPPFLKRVFSA